MQKDELYLFRLTVQSFNKFFKKKVIINFYPQIPKKNIRKKLLRKK